MKDALSEVGRLARCARWIAMANRHLETQDPPRHGDLLLMTTDGVHGVLAADVLASAGRETPEPEALAARLVQAAMENGSRDNCTALVARYELD